ncbi:MAG: exodeoxyribonuclease VII large subunit [Isosphaeraceae bacterium]|nr:exodeoxyribonuclease VII large subunit [Isosphaeraceae bacterium]
MSVLSLFNLADGPEGSGFCTVSELTAQIKATLETEFAEVALRAEISNLSRPRSGHVYFGLKDDSASIRAVMWKNDAQRVVFDLADGLAVKVWGRVTVYAPRGDYQIQVRKIEPVGIGPLELAFRQTVARLAAEGLFEPGRKRPLPRWPRRIVVVTSPTGAAVRDFLHVVGRRWRGTEILIVPAKVQGVGAAEEIAAGLALANRVAGADLVVLARGGGSLEDLWAFNEEIVARAIVASRLPVISAIGHEVDVTIADLAADRRALTPSEAGEICVPDAGELRAAVTRLGERLTRAGQGRIEQTRQRLDWLGERLDRAARQGLETRRHRLARLAAGLEALSPLGVLARGYTVTLRDDGTTLVRSAGDVRPGDLIQTRLAEGRIVSRVEGTT